MSFSIFKIFQIFGIVSNWAVKALADNRVTLTEAVDLVSQLCEVLGVVPELQLPGSEPTEEEVIQDTSIQDAAPFDGNNAADPARAPPLVVPDKIEGAA